MNMRAMHKIYEVCFSISVFFNLVAAAEPSANVCLVRGTPCYCETLVLQQPHRSVVANFVPGSFGLFRRKPRQLLAEPRLKSTALYDEP